MCKEIKVLIVGLLLTLCCVPMSSKEVGDTLVVDSASPHTTLKINALGLGMAIPNLAVEVDLVPHLSLALPFY